MSLGKGHPLGEASTVDLVVPDEAGSGCETTKVGLLWSMSRPNQWPGERSNWLRVLVPSRHWHQSNARNCLTSSWSIIVYLHWKNTNEAKLILQKWKSIQATHHLADVPPGEYLLQYVRKWLDRLIICKQLT